MRRQTDRLATGELSDAERAEVFDWCNEDPWRWRDCALAFLEAQSWGEVMSEWTKEADPLPVADRYVSAGQAALPVWRRWAALAATLVIVFFAGAGMHDWMLRSRTLPDWAMRDATTGSPAPEETSQETGGATTTAHQSPVRDKTSQHPTYVSVPVQTNLTPGVPALLQIPVAAEQDGARAQPVKSTLPDYVRKQWEKRGYEVEQTKRFLNGKLPDGRNVVVPVNGLEVKYVGRPVY